MSNLTPPSEFPSAWGFFSCWFPRHSCLWRRLSELQDLAVSAEPGNKNHLPEILFGTRRDIHKQAKSHRRSGGQGWGGLFQHGGVWASPEQALRASGRWL